VIFTYFGYARQDHPKPNVARAAHIICNCLKQFDIHKSTIIHPHSAQLQQDISYDRFVPYQLYAPLVKELDIDTIVSPDTGGILACQELAQQTHCQIGSIEKERNANDQIITTVDAINLPSKLTRVLIFDDIVSTGATIINAATILKEHGALTIYALVTHCFMNEITMQKLTESPVQHLWVTNSVPIHTKSSHITVINLAPAITTIIRGTFAI
jgi:ribose-phosphate pyrophosphokinase